MTLLLKQIFNFLRLLNSDKETNPLAWGLALGVILGFAPFFSLQTLLVIFVIFVFRVQMGAAFISAFFFKFIAFLFDQSANHLGQDILESHALRPLLTELYNMPLVPMTRFNNSLVMGSLVISLILFPVLFFVFKALILKYRQTVVARFRNTKVWRIFTATKFYNWYAQYTSLYGH